MANEKHKPLGARIVERRLFGLVTCRIGLCGKDGTVGVDLPAYDTGGMFANWVRVWRCEEHAQQELSKGKKEKSPHNDIFGWSCIVAYRPYGSEETIEKEIHRRGKTASCVTSAAKRMNSYRSHRELTSYTKEEWIRMFGIGSETGRYMIG